MPDERAPAGIGSGVRGPARVAPRRPDRPIPSAAALDAARQLDAFQLGERRRDRVLLGRAGPLHAVVAVLQMIRQFLDERLVVG